MTGRSGREVANQFIITSEDGQVFQSYKSMVAFKTRDGRIMLDPIYWNFSKTTKRHLGNFLGEPASVINEKVKNGTYKLENLN